MRIRAVVDRIEGEVAVLLVGQPERRVDFPLECLPPVHEGAMLWLSWEMDKLEEAARKDQAVELLQKLLQRKQQ